MNETRSTGRDIVVGFAGMTHLGLVSASAAAQKGFRTICYDQDAALIAQLAAGRLSVKEPDLDNLLKNQAERLVFTATIEQLADCDLVYISSDVPTDDSGRSSLNVIEALIQAVLSSLKSDALLVMLCQVPPGFTRAIEGISPSRLYYQVETLVFGRAVARALRPERIIVGCATPEAPLDPRLSAVLATFECPLLSMRYESAELAKIAINCCLVSSISVANTLSELCEKIGADWSEIAPALKLDARIGPSAYLAPGLGIAGGNLERDLATVMQLAKDHGTNADVVKAWLTNSRHCRGWADRTIRRAVLTQNPTATVAVWGLTYKEDTHSLKNSPSLATIAGLPEARFIAHDPAAPLDAVASVRVSRVFEPMQALSEAEALMILTPWREYRAISVADIAKGLKGRVVIDPYSVLDHRHAKAVGLDHYSLGRPHEPAEGGD
jgi:UDPglucose 6-dehydrogenase